MNGLGRQNDSFLHRMHIHIRMWRVLDQFLVLFDNFYTIFHTPQTSFLRRQTPSFLSSEDLRRHRAAGGVDGDGWSSQQERMSGAGEENSPDIPGFANFR